jgi:hypothetical protein
MRFVKVTNKNIVKCGNYGTKCVNTSKLLTFPVSAIQHNQVRNLGRYTFILDSGVSPKYFRDVIICACIHRQMMNVYVHVCRARSMVSVSFCVDLKCAMLLDSTIYIYCCCITIM